MPRQQGEIIDLRRPIVTVSLGRVWRRAISRPDRHAQSTRRNSRAQSAAVEQVIHDSVPERAPFPCGRVDGSPAFGLRAGGLLDQPVVEADQFGQVR
jgi:hypothetical protein